MPWKSFKKVCRISVNYVCVLLYLYWDAYFYNVILKLISDLGTCDSDKKGGCQHNCTSLTGGGYICTCPPGYRVNHDDPKQCIGMNLSFVSNFLNHSQKEIMIVSLIVI